VIKVSVKEISVQCKEDFFFPPNNQDCPQINSIALGHSKRGSTLGFSEAPVNEVV
jgi:hypothetical protein